MPPHRPQPTVGPTVRQPTTAPDPPRPLNHPGAHHRAGHPPPPPRCRHPRPPAAPHRAPRRSRAGRGLPLPARAGRGAGLWGIEACFREGAWFGSARDGGVAERWGVASGGEGRGLGQFPGVGAALGGGGGIGAVLGVLGAVSGCRGSEGVGEAARGQSWGKPGRVRAPRKCGREGAEPTFGVPPPPSRDRDSGTPLPHVTLYFGVPAPGPSQVGGQRGVPPCPSVPASGCPLRSTHQHCPRFSPWEARHCGGGGRNWGEGGPPRPPGRSWGGSALRSTQQGET